MAKSSKVGVLGLFLFTTSWLAHAPNAFAGPEANSGAADSGAIHKARAQFQQGLALEMAGDWAGALAIFQQVAAVKFTPQVRFHIGLCEEHLGRLAAALGDYELAAHEAEDARAAEVSTQVAARREDLRARIPKLTITRGQGAEFATVSLDGVELGASSIGISLPVDPGPHNVTARAPGFQPFSVAVEIAEKDAKKVEMTLVRNAVAEPALEARPALVVPRSVAEPSRSKVLPLAIGGAGVASLGASAVFFVLRQDAINTLDSQCVIPPDNHCPLDAKATFDRGKTYTLVADITLGVGVAALGTGVILLLTGAKPPSSGSRLNLAPMASTHSLGAVVGASF